ncbi:ABC transporter substrate-binding protein [Roseisolibacter agri]|nr:ABC transporter substrate-binding protein [Roseisolibacter agri]
MPDGSRRLVLLLLLAATACGGESRGPTIGIAVDSDGRIGAEYAAADVNATGGIGGDSLRLRLMPTRDATRAQMSIGIADSLAADASVVAVVGHSNSAASLAASQIYNERRLPHIAPNTTAPLFSAAGPYSFRLVPDDRRQAAFMAAEVARAGARRVAIAFVNDDYGRGLQGALRTDLARRGTAVVYETPYLERGDSGRVATVARAMAAARPDLLLWLGRPDQLDLMRRALAPLLPSLPVLASDGLDVSRVYAQRDRYQSVRFVRFVDPEGPGEALAAFRTRFRAGTRREPTTDAVLSYDATMLLAAALRDGARTREEVRAWLAGVGTTRPAYQGISGPIAFDSAGDVVRPHRLAEVHADGVRAVSVP